MSYSRPGVSFWICAALLVSVTCGCGGQPTGTVSGKVNLDGAPVGGGMITFISSDGYAATGEIGADGSFTLVGELPPGSYTVSVSPPALMEAPGDDGTAGAEVAPTAIPDIYWSETTSGIKQDIAVGENSVTIELSSQQGP